MSKKGGRRHLHFSHKWQLEKEYFLFAGNVTLQNEVPRKTTSFPVLMMLRHLEVKGEVQWLNRETWITSLIMDSLFTQK